MNIKKSEKDLIKVWNYEIGFYKYINRTESIINCINIYPITPFIQKYISEQSFINIEFENDKPKLIEGKIVVLI